MNRKQRLIWGLWVLIVTVTVLPVDYLSAETKVDAGPSLDVEMAATVQALAEAAPSPPAQAEEMSMLDLIEKGGYVGYVIILTSILSIGLIIDYGFTLRRSKILPPKDIATLKTLITTGRFQEIIDMDTPRASFLTRLTAAGVKESHLGYHTMIKAMEDAGESLSARLSRKIEHLNVIGNLAPMLGLLGTVTGMLRCFNQLAHVAGAIEPKQLAGGIFEALVTTCMGLIVAIPALYSYAVFRDRVDEFTGEAGLLAEQLVAPFKGDKQGE